MKTNLELDGSEFWLHHLKAVRPFPSYVTSPVSASLYCTEDKNNNTPNSQGFVKSKWHKYKVSFYNYAWHM